MTDRGTILIVGAGPTGLSAAILLRLRGHDPIVIDRREGLGNLPAAHVLNTRSCEILAEMGAVDAALRLGDGLAAGNGKAVVWAESLAGREFGRLPLVDARKDERGPVSSFGSLNRAQNRVEALLHDRFVALGGVVRFGHQALDVRETESGVEVAVRSSDNGDARTGIHDWVIGCVGAGSIVRRSTRIEMEGPRSLARFMTIYFRADLGSFVRDRQAILYWIGGKDVRGVLINFEKATGTWAMLVPIGELPTMTFDMQATRRILHKAIGSEDVAPEIFAVSEWNMSAQVASSYREGRVFLAGDACHRFPPMGGLGMNTGIQDAHNLVWKLTAVIEGAPDALLDSYERERRPIAKRNTDQSVGNLLKLSLIDDALGISTLASVRPDAGEGAITLHPAGALLIDGEHPETEDRRSALRDAIAAQAAHFAQGVGMDLGFAYEAGALVPDGSTPPSADDGEYRPDARPGARLPYAAVSGRFEDSTLGQVRSTGITLFSADDRWSKIVRRIGSDGRVPIHFVRVEAQTFGERVGDLLGIGPDGAVAVRPDGHVLWRTAEWRTNAEADLRHAVAVGYGYDRTADGPAELSARVLQSQPDGCPMSSDGC